MKTAARVILGDWIYDKLWTGLTRKEPENEAEMAYRDEDTASHQ
jgi:hypothetical protein